MCFFRSFVLYNCIKIHGAKKETKKKEERLECIWPENIEVFIIKRSP